MRSLHELSLREASGKADGEDLYQRATSRISVSRSPGSGYPMLHAVVAGGPRSQVLRPAELESEELSDRLLSEALTGSNRVFELAEGTSSAVEDGRLALVQSGARIDIDDLGTIHVAFAIDSRRSGVTGSLGLAEEDVRAALVRALGFLGWAIDAVDPTRRLAEVQVVAGITGGGWLGWVTAEEAAKQGGALSVGSGTDPLVVPAEPAVRPRTALHADRGRIAEDLLVLLRRAKRGLR